MAPLSVLLSLVWVHRASATISNASKLDCMSVVGNVGYQGIYEADASGNDGVFFTFTLNETSLIEASDCGSAFDTRLYILASDGVTDLSSAQYCNTNGRDGDDCGTCTPSSSTNEHFTMRLPAGTYYIKLTNYFPVTSTDQYSVDLTCTPTASLLPTSAPTPPPIATPSPIVASAYCGFLFSYYLSEGETQYYRLSIDSFETVYINTCDSSFDTKLYILDSNLQDISSTSYCNSNGRDGDDCGDCGTNEQFSMPLDAGDYYVKVTSYTYSSITNGNYNLNVRCGYTPSPTYYDYDYSSTSSSGTTIGSVTGVLLFIVIVGCVARVCLINRRRSAYVAGGTGAVGLISPTPKVIVAGSGTKAPPVTVNNYAPPQGQTQGQTQGPMVYAAPAQHQQYNMQPVQSVQPQAQVQAQVEAQYVAQQQAQARAPIVQQGQAQVVYAPVQGQAQVQPQVQMQAEAPPAYAQVAQPVASAPSAYEGVGQQNGGTAGYQ